MLVQAKAVELGRCVPGEGNAFGAGGVSGRGDISGVGKYFWVLDYWDRYIRDDRHLESVVDYIHYNPVKAGLCRNPQDRP
jgi:REP element-mobilizing transposase RayT